MKISHHTPVNRLAAKVIRKGIEYTPDKKIVQVHSDVPLPTISPSYNEIDLSGKRFGRFVVIGKFKPKEGNKNGKARWVVRCACGRYETRSSKAINNPHNSADCCDECRQLEFLKRRDRDYKP